MLTFRWRVRDTSIVFEGSVQAQRCIRGAKPVRLSLAGGLQGVPTAGRRGRAPAVPLEGKRSAQRRQARRRQGMKARKVETQSGSMRSTTARPGASRETPGQ